MMNRFKGIVPVVVAVLTFSVASGGAQAGNECRQTANLLYQACLHEVEDDVLKTRAACVNEVGAEAIECRQESQAMYREASRECQQVRSERRQVCVAVGRGAYQPAFGEGFEDQFVDPDDIGGAVTPNPYLPLVVGMEWVYRMETEDEEGDPVVEDTLITVTDKVKEIDGILCRVVRDTVKINGELLEDTNDWMAQDIWGNVWYCGEEVKDYEIFEGDSPAEPELVAIDGSFKAGEEDAKAGILMFADPQVGVTYREEAAWNEAEDLSEVLSITASESVGGFDCGGQCLELRAFSPMDPGVNELKYWLKGVGKLLEIKAETGERNELIEVRFP